MNVLKQFGSDAYFILRDPFGFFQRLHNERRAGKDFRDWKYIASFILTFTLVPALLFPLWKPLIDWTISVSAVKVVDFHFGNKIYIALSRDFYSLYYSYLGNPLLVWLACIPTLMLDMMFTLLFASILTHVVAKYLLGGEGRLGDGLACVALGDLPSLLFGFLPFSAGIGLAWTTLLQFTVSTHYLYKVPWNRGLIPFIFFSVFLFVAWSLFGTVSPPGLLNFIPHGPYEVP